MLDRINSGQKEKVRFLVCHLLSFLPFFPTGIADDERQRLLRDRQLLRDEWQDQVDRKQKQVSLIFEKIRNSSYGLIR